MSSSKRQRATRAASDELNQYSGWTVGDATSVAVVDAAALDSARFVRDFVAQRRPCIITGLLDTPAFGGLRRWTDLKHLRARCGADVSPESRSLS